MSKPAKQARKCDSFQVNSIRTHDFSCRLQEGHAGAHTDSISGQRWGEPSVPRGMRKPKRGQ